MATLKFFYNGIKGSDGKLQTARYSDGELLNHPRGTITIYARQGFSGDVAKAFAIENGTDIMTDYFERDRIRVAPTHPLYSEVKAALAKAEARNAAKRADLQAKFSARYDLDNVWPS
jgi:hypothetical protein